MKKLLILLAGIFTALAAYAQTPDEIIARMEQAMDGHENDGMAMTMDMKIPILGTVSTRSYMLGDKLRIEGKMMNRTIVSFIDGTTVWDIDDEKKEVIIKTKEKTAEPSESEKNAEMFSGITDGYDVSIKSETAEVWNIVCKKSKSNTVKDDPKTMNLTIRKKDYIPVSLSAKMSGVTVIMRDLVYGIKDSQVTFNASNYPGYNIKDER